MDQAEDAVDLLQEKFSASLGRVFKVPIDLVQVNLGTEGPNDLKLLRHHLSGFAHEPGRGVQSMG